MKQVCTNSISGDEICEIYYLCDLNIPRIAYSHSINCHRFWQLCGNSGGLTSVNREWRLVIIKISPGWLIRSSFIVMVSLLSRCWETRLYLVLLRRVTQDRGFLANRILLSAQQSSTSLLLCLENESLVFLQLLNFTDSLNHVQDLTDMFQFPQGYFFMFCFSFASRFFWRTPLSFNFWSHAWIIVLSGSPFMVNSHSRIQVTLNFQVQCFHFACSSILSCFVSRLQLSFFMEMSKF